MLVRPAFCGPGTKGPHDGHYWPLNEGLFRCWKLFRLLLLIFVKNNPFCNYFAGNRWPRQMPNARNNGFFAPVRFGPEVGWEFLATNRPEHLRFVRPPLVRMLPVRMAAGCSKQENRYNTSRVELKGLGRQNDQAVGSRQGRQVGRILPGHDFHHRIVLVFPMCG